MMFVSAVRRYKPSECEATRQRHYWKSRRLPEPSDEVIDTFVQRVDAITSPFSQISGWAVGGAVSRVDAEATSHRSSLIWPHVFMSGVAVPYCGRPAGW